MANPSTDHAQFDERDHLAPVPDDNRPGHHPDVEQDKPDAEAFAARFGSGGGGGADNGATGAPVLAIVPGEVRSVPNAVFDVVRAAACTASPVVRGLRSFAARRIRGLADLLEPEPARRGG